MHIVFYTVCVQVCFQWVKQRGFDVHTASVGTKLVWFLFSVPAYCVDIIFVLMLNHTLAGTWR